MDSHTDTCSVHVRRGDYGLTGWKYVPLGADYYERAIEFMRDHECKRFLVFSDDIEWCKENFPKDFEFVTALSDIQSLCLMSKCSYHIIANSTYSWWGSWLADPGSKTVIAPHTWYSFRYSVINNDLYQFCPEWILIRNRINLRKQLWSLINTPDKKLFLLSI